MLQIRCYFYPAPSFPPVEPETTNGRRDAQRFARQELTAALQCQKAWPDHRSEAMARFQGTVS